MSEMACSSAICAKNTALEHQVAEFFREMRPVARIDGVEDLVGLFERVRLDGVEGLLAIPRTTAGSAQASHDLDQPLKSLAGAL